MSPEPTCVVWTKFVGSPIMERSIRRRRFGCGCSAMQQLKQTQNSVILRQTKKPQQFPLSLQTTLCVCLPVQCYQSQQTHAGNWWQTQTTGLSRGKLLAQELFSQHGTAHSRWRTVYRRKNVTTDWKLKNAKKKNPNQELSSLITSVDFRYREWPLPRWPTFLQEILL